MTTAKASLPYPKNNARSRKKPRVGSVIMTVLSFILTTIWIFPVIWAFFVSLKVEGSPIRTTWDWFSPPYTTTNYMRIMLDSAVPRWFLNSVLITLVSVVIVVLTSAMAAFAIAKIKFPGRKALYFFFLIGLMVPGEATIVPLFLTANALNLIDTYWGLILPGLASSFNLIIMITFFKGVPDELMESARIDGAGDFRIFSQILLPLTKPVVVTITIFTFIGTWNNYLWPLLSAMSEDMFTLTVGLPTFVGTYSVDFTMPMAANMFSAIPIIMVYLLGEKHIVEGIALSGVKG